MSYLDATKAITTDFGIWQHTKDDKPRQDKGYALDDATRGLLLYLLAEQPTESQTLFTYITSSYQHDTWYGFATDEGRFFRHPASEDAVGQVAWASGLALALGFQTEEARFIFEQAKASLHNPHYLRGSAYALLGATYIDREWADQLAHVIIEKFDNTTPDWPWPETALTYGNAAPPLALLRYGRLCNNDKAIEIGRRILDWIDRSCRLNEPLGPVGNHGWFEAGMERPAQFGQQPIDVAYMIWAYLAAHEVTGSDHDLDKAEDWLTWFHGNNVADAAVGNRTTGHCFDGIDGPGHVRVSRDSGAESRICYALTLWAMEHRQSF